MTLMDVRHRNHAPRARLTRSLQLRPDVAVQQTGDTLEISHPWGRHRIGGLGQQVTTLLLAMADGGVGASCGQQDGRCVDSEAVLMPFLRRFPFLVATTISDAAGQALLTFVPIARPAVPLHDYLDASRDCEVLPAVSRFCYLRRYDNGGVAELVMESPLSEYRVTLHQPKVATLVAGLTGQLTLAELARVAELPVESVQALVGMLWHAGFLDSGTDPARELWDFHDLVFHSRSRAGRHDYPSGGLFLHQDVAQRPAVPPPSDLDGPPIDLPVPEWESVLERDPKLSEVLEGRRSVRAYDEQPVSLDQLGELLYRSARVRRVIPGLADSPTAYDIVDRPYPAGGATGDLEFYLSVVDCAGLEPGVYRYDAASHQLRRRNTGDAAFRELVTGAWRATNQTVMPQVLITVVSRIERLSWKYSQIAYSLTLKHVGVLYQTLYLVATAMGLAPCGLGSGDSEAAARALGLDWTSDCAVGEFLIGSLGPERPGAPTGFVDVVGAYRARVRP
jgi:SagB-type dehydrogenase family enzyme